MSNIRFIKEIVEPDLEMRRILYKKLRSIGKRPQSEIKRTLRSALDSCNGRIDYYLIYKGFKIYIGDDKLPKKYFRLFKGPLFLRKEIGDLRRQMNRKPIVSKRRYLSSIDETVVYNKDEGGVMIEPNVFGSLFKTVGRKKVFKSKRPDTYDSYIGIELEYASKLSLDQVADLILEAGLHNKVRVMNDSSIRITNEFPHRIELCVLSKYTDLADNLNKLRKIIDNRFMTNNSCGLHVHLDARHSDVKKVYKNLVLMQNVLFQMADESRRENAYCRFVSESSFELANSDDHYAAISKSSWYKHKSIEVRIHHSTTDLTMVERWVNLLKKIADYQGTDLTFGNITDGLKALKETIKLEPDLLKYVEEKVAI